MAIMVLQGQFHCLGICKVTQMTQEPFAAHSPAPETLHQYR